MTGTGAVDSGREVRMNRGQKVARILSGRIPIYTRKKRDLGMGGEWKYWRCVCGDPGVTSKSLPHKHECPVCAREFVIFDPKESGP